MTTEDRSAAWLSRAPTIKDVAALAGVGVKTVSRVLNNEPNVRPEKRARILEAVATLHYQRNTSASSIRRLDQRTASIGLVVEDLANPFASLLARLVQDYALERQHLVLVGSSDGVAERERELVAEFCARRVDGLLIVPSGTDQSYLEAERRRRVPVVFVDRPGGRINADTVLSENDRGIRDAVHHLNRHGHSCIAYLGDRQSICTAAQRMAGYRSAMEELGAEVDSRYIHIGLRDSTSAYQATLDVLTQTPAPTALVCGTNRITAGAVYAMQKLGVRERVAVIGFDDLELADLLQPALTVIVQDIATIGRRAADLLFEQLQHPTDGYRHIAVPVTLVPRGSGEIPAPDDTNER